MKKFKAIFSKKAIKGKFCEDTRCHCDKDEAYCIIETEYDRYAVCESQFQSICNNTDSEIEEVI